MSLLQELKRAVTIDFETEPIEPRPDYPPKPVGVAIKFPRKKAMYFVDWWAMRYQLKTLFLSDVPLLFHNAKFDVDVACTHFKLPRPVPHRIHDTVTLLFLTDPYAKDYHLKESAERILNEPPAERDEIVDWLIEHQPVKGVKLVKAKYPKAKNHQYAGRWVCKAPWKMVAKYANGDVDRTRKLALKVGGEVSKDERLVQAYRREQEMEMLTLDMEREGVPVARARLGRDIKMYTTTLQKVERWLCKKLKVKELDFDKNADLGEALLDSGLAREEDFLQTPTGLLSTSKASLDQAIKDKQLAAMLRYRGALTNCLRNFMVPWFEKSKATGRIYVKWSSTRRDSDKRRGTSGARTGRLASSPNLQNITKLYPPLFGIKPLPRCPIKGLPPLPLMRSYIIAEKGHVLLDRDFDSQELRMLAYFEDGDIAEAFCENPKLDLHQRVADDLGISRRDAKTVNFAILYGVGQGHLAEMLGVSVDDAKSIKRRYFEKYPSVKDLSDALKDLGKNELPVRTWGGRKYLPEPPKWVDGRMRDYLYKLLNYLIQGSSADLTKQAMLDFAAVKHPSTRIYGSVHDEILVSAQKRLAKSEMEKLKEVMSREYLQEIPLRSSGKTGPNFGSMKGCG